MASNISKLASKSVISRFITNLKGMPIIMAIALGGILSRSFVNHPELVTEYGVHWNFFWTLAVITLATSFVTSVHLLNYIGLGLHLLYQVCLYSGLGEFILNGPRDNFFSKNREGILGCIGYICIYMFGAGFTEFVIKRSEIGKSKFLIPKLSSIAYKLLIYTICSGIIMVLLNEYVQSFSRRTVNASYGVSIGFATSVAMLGGYFALSMLKKTEFNYV
jgi:phosphatidylinositol glycan class W